MTLYGLLDRFFEHEIIDGNGLRAYLHRWVLWRGKSSAWYLHHFIGSDWSLDLHDHPKEFLSIGLRGGYWEWRPGECEYFRAPWIRHFPAEHIHRLVLPPGDTAWTLVRVGEKTREWGFWYDGDWIPWDQYTYSELAELRLDPGEVD